MRSLSISLFLSWLTAIVTTAALTHVAKSVSRRLGILDFPYDRKIHTKPIPCMGGVAMFGGFLSGVTMFTLLSPDQTFLARETLEGCLIGGMVICAIGLWDDTRGANAPTKLFIETLVALFMWKQGLRVESISVPFGGVLTLNDQHELTSANLSTFALSAGSMIITILWYVLLMNAINLIDGLDGLAASISMTAAIVIVGVATITHTRPPVEALLIGILAASVCLGFLPYNWRPASIYMGDTGALFLGFLLATTSLLSSTKAPALLTLLIPLLAIGLPIVESVHSFFRRLVNQKNPFQADRRHLHHRLLDLGFSQRRVVLTMVYLTILLGVLSFLLATASEIMMGALALLLIGGFWGLIENVRFLENARGTAHEK